MGADSVLRATGLKLTGCYASERKETALDGCYAAVDPVSDIGGERRQVFGQCR